MPPPTISSNPDNQQVAFGLEANFAVTACCVQAYQWQKDGVTLQNNERITGATGPQLKLSGIKFSDAGNYQVVITNSAGTVTSTVANLTVLDNQGPAIIVSNSTRQTVTQRRYTLNGMVTDAGQGNHGVQNVWVNGLLLTNVSGAGDESVPWSQIVTLQPGMNPIFISAADAVGNCTTNLFQVNFLPTGPGIPSLTITPPRSPTYSNLVMVTGTAADAKGVSEVWCRLNFDAWVLANGTKKWNIQLVPPMGTNILTAYAVDTEGNYSKAASVKIVKLATDTLNIIHLGNGTFTPNWSGKALDVNKSYMMKAVPVAGNLFSNCIATRGLNGPVLWTTNRPDLKFTMESNLVLTVNFVTNAFLSRKGDYVGLFCPSNDVFLADWTNSGAVKLTVTDKGTFTGQLTHQGKVYPFTAGAFNLGGFYSNSIARGKDPALQVLVNLDLSGGGGVTGTVKQGTNWLSNLWADLALKKAAKTNYLVAVVIEPDGTNIGKCTLSVQLSGIATLIGTLSDKTKLTGSFPLTTQNEVILYQTLYGGKGMWMGYVSLVSTSRGGEAHWQKLPNPVDKLNPQGSSVNAVLLLP
ncbi:MAG: hypothetical protein WCO56_03560 [Verrucomicrobiota bacterium]